MDGQKDGWMEAMPEGTQIRSLARSSTGLPHLAHSHCTKSYGRRSSAAPADDDDAGHRGHGEQSKWLPSPAGLPAGLFWSGWMDGSWPRPRPSVRPFIVGVMQL